MEKLKKQKYKIEKRGGITLIALVITIIVLLILAAISIAMLTGDNSILKRAVDAKERTERAEIIENAKMDILGKISEKNGANLTEEEIEEVLIKYGVLLNNNEASIFEKKLKTTKGNYDILVKEIYEGDLAPELDTGYGLYDYETGKLKKSWSKLLKEGVIRVNENGELLTQYANYKNDSSEILDGKLVISDDVLSLGNYSFAMCSRLKQVVLSNSINNIGQSAFYNCDELISLNIPNSVTNVGAYAFQNCKRIVNITIPYGMDNINNGTFMNCHSLTSISIPNSVTMIGESAFYECISLIDFSIPENVMSIGKDAFYRCESITNIVIPKSVTSIGDNAFSNMYKLESLTIEGKVSYTGHRVFDGTGPELKNIILGCDDLDNGMDTIDEACWFSWSPSISNITLKKSITTIKAGAFGSLKGITSLTIPENVTTIENPAFYNWTSSQTINVTRYSSSSEATGYMSGWNGSATVKWKGQF